MGHRIAWALLGTAIGAVAGFVLACAVVIVGAGVFWIFIFGDDTWPAAAETALTVTGGLIWLTGAAIGGVAGWNRVRATQTPFS